MSDDRQLLEDAARAAGIEIEWHRWPASGPEQYFRKNGDSSEQFGEGYSAWNPLTDDGDALRLAVKLRLDIDHHADSVNVWQDYFGTGFIPNGDDPAAATRRAITRAAAAIGRQKEAE